MHIDTLYKSVPFLDREKILANLPVYKKKKQQQYEEKLRRDEELLKSGKKKKAKRDEENKQVQVKTNESKMVSSGNQHRKDVRLRSTEVR